MNNNKKGRIKKMKKILFCSLCLLGIFSVIAIQNPALAEEPIIIGAAVDLSGLFSPWDVPCTQALEYALEKQNEKGGINGRKLKLIKGDTKSDITLAPQVALDLIDRGAVMMMVT
jgi:ABC-type branched-subunit amino acid transport system substrate-binding protein